MPASGTARSGLRAGIRRATFAGSAMLAIAMLFAAGSGWSDMPAGNEALHPALNRVERDAARYADFGPDTASPDARRVADWVADSRDAAGSDFVIVDKRQAKLYIFDSYARLRGSTAVLLGAARGDDSVPDIGTRPISRILPAERTTPAGRFVAERGHDISGVDVVWVDYDAAISMHRVLTTNPRERRLARLASPSVEDNRISYGCINVPAVFYETHIRPMFALRRAVVYVLPEVKPVQRVFGSFYDVAAAHGAPARQ